MVDIYELNKMPRYIHTSYDESLFLEKEKQRIGYKPHGLWFSRGTDWLYHISRHLGYKHIKFGRKYLYIYGDKTRVTEIGIEYQIPKAYLYCVTINSNNKIKLSDKPEREKILILSTLDELTQFYDKYGIDKMIDWVEVSRYYAGIELCNYLNMTREIYKNKHNKQIYNKAKWFIKFDINGGCIWRYDNIKIKKIEPSNISCSKYDISQLTHRVHISTNCNYKIGDVSELKHENSYQNMYTPDGIRYANKLEQLMYMNDVLGYDYIQVGGKYVCIYDGADMYFSDGQKRPIDNVCLYNIQIDKENIIFLHDKPDKDKLLKINTYPDVIEFCRKYGEKTKESDKKQPRYNINWQKVEKDYAGIDIRNYTKLIDKYNMVEASKNANEQEYYGKWINNFEMNGGFIWNMKNVNINKIMPL